MVQKNVQKNIQKLLNLPDVTIINHDPQTDMVKAETEQPAMVVNVEEKELQDDFDLARKNIRELSEIGRHALKGILDVADQDGEARPYEVAGQIMKTLSEINKDLLDIHEKKNNTKVSNSGKSDEHSNVTNAVFVGSTQELLEMLKKKNG